MVCKILYRMSEIIYKGFGKVILIPGIKKSFGSCGKNVRIGFGCDFKPAKNIYVGNNCQIGARSLFWSTRAKIILKDYVLMGPGVTIITGDHRTDIVGKHIIEVSDDEKLPEHDGDVVIESGTWIGANVTILKDVIIGEGAVVAAGAVVTKNVEPYTIVAGVPAKKIKNRFSEMDLEEHRCLLIKRGLDDEKK